jgi:hypothetical protein
MGTKNKRASAVIDPEPDAQVRKQEECQAAEDWAVIERLQARNADADPDEVLADATAAVEEVRQERYDERQARRRR